ncbi:Progestin and adipoQ receptor family member 3, partial [Eschrichtius robustus]|nr:Progestin and adipoQ receptor family member 3 [Eschrichtius robustus]
MDICIRTSHGPLIQLWVSGGHKVISCGTSVNTCKRTSQKTSMSMAGILSLFILSNETVNIWSHLLGFFLFFTLGIYDMTSVLPSASASREDFVICSICLFCFQVCMLCSVGYHLFSCHRSEKTCRRWMALDYAGISIGILGCYVSGVFYAFYCNNLLPLQSQD